MARILGVQYRYDSAVQPKPLLFTARILGVMYVQPTPLLFIATENIHLLPPPPIVNNNTKSPKLVLYLYNWSRHDPLLQGRFPLLQGRFPGQQQQQRWPSTETANLT
jgi:hypothetical protein